MHHNASFINPRDHENYLLKSQHGGAVLAISLSLLEDDGLVHRSTFKNYCLEDAILFSLHIRIEEEEFEVIKLVTMFTYEAIFCGRVADFPHFVGQVIADLQIFADKLVAVVSDVLVLSVIIFFNRHRFNRIRNIEELRERYKNWFLGVCSLLRW